MSLTRPILKHALLHPKRVAIVDDQRTMTYGQLAAAAFNFAQTIQRTTDKPHVALMLPTSSAFPVAVLGCWLAKKVPVPINYLLGPEPLKHVLLDCEADTVVSVGKMLEVLGGPEIIPAPLSTALMEEMNLKRFPALRWPPGCPGDGLGALLYTSGTSGLPKGVMLSHKNLIADVQHTITYAEIDHTRTFIGVLPQFHAFGLTALTLMPLIAGAKIVYTARFVPRRLIQLIKEHQVDVMMAVPSMYHALLNVKKAEPEDMASMQIAVSGAEPLPARVREQFKDRFNISILEGYGLTETSPITHWSTPGASRVQSVGRSIPCVTTLIVDENNNVLGPDEEGEILLAGDNIMRGYFKLPEKTDAAFVELEHDGQTLRCFRTGDIGKQDADGFLYITGRLKEMLIVSGENVFPREIEEALNAHPAVSASAVIGAPDDARGEVPIAFVELVEEVDEAEFDEGAVRAFVRERIAPFKTPREVRVLKELPRNPTGKILRRELTV